jgi:protease I
VEAAQFDGLIIPGGLGTWLIRGHRGLQKLVREMDVAHKPIAAIERGPKVLLSAGILTGRTVTCSGEMRDDLIAAGLSYCDEPIVRDEYLLFCQGTEALPEWGRAWIEMWEKIVPQCE